MGFFNFVSNIGSTLKAGYEFVRDRAGKVIDLLANEGENVVANIKDAWKFLSPHLKKISPFLKSIAAMAPYPWLKAAILAFDVALTTLLALENSPILKKLEAAINWAVKWARNHQQQRQAAEQAAPMTPAEEAEARAHQDSLRKGRGEVPAESQAMLDLAELIANYALANTAIEKLLQSGGFENFEHYLRLRATQKLLKSVEAIFQAAQTAQQISPDDRFLMRVADDLLVAAPALTQADATRLDRIVLQRYGKKLLPFVFEEMTKAWQINLSGEEVKWKEMSATLSRDEVMLKRLELAKHLSALATEEQVIFDRLQLSVPVDQQRYKAWGQRLRMSKAIVHASEGFMQLQEKTEAQLEADDQLYLLDQSGEIATILIDFMQNRRPLEDMTAEQRRLIIDYANIFAKACEARARTLVEECNV